MKRPVRKPFSEAAVKELSGEENPKKRYPSPVTVRLKPDERELLEEAANDLSLSAYIRFCLFGDDIPKHRTRGKQPVKDYKALGELLAILGRSNLAYNINQLAKAANQGDVILPPDAEIDLKTAAVKIAAMRLLLIKALGLQGDG